MPCRLCMYDGQRKTHSAPSNATKCETLPKREREREKERENIHHHHTHTRRGRHNRTQPQPDTPQALDRGVHRRGTHFPVSFELGRIRRRHAYARINLSRVLNCSFSAQHTHARARAHSHTRVFAWHCFSLPAAAI